MKKEALAALWAKEYVDALGVDASKDVLLKTAALLKGAGFTNHDFVEAARKTERSSIFNSLGKHYLGVEIDEGIDAQTKILEAGTDPLSGAFRLLSLALAERSGASSPDASEARGLSR